MSRNDDQDMPYLSTDDSLSDDPYGFEQESSFHADYSYSGQQRNNKKAH